MAPDPGPGGAIGSPVTVRSVDKTIDRHSLEAGLTAVASWSVVLVVSRYLLVTYGIDPWTYTFLQLMAGGAVILAITRGRRTDWSDLRRTDTWAYGGLRVVSAATFTAAVGMLPVMLVGLLGMITVPLAAIGAWLVFGRRPTRRGLWGQALVIGGILMLAAQLPGGFGHPAIPLLLFSEVAVVASALIVERHPGNNAADPWDRLRFTGIVLLVTAATFLVWRVGQVGIGVAVGIDGTAALQVLTDPVLWIGGVLVGILGRGPCMHLGLRAIRLMGADSYVALLVLLPVFTGVLEAGLAAAGLLPPVSIDGPTVALGLLILTGSLWVIWAKRRPPATATATAG